MLKLRIEEILKEKGMTKYQLNKRLDNMCYRNFNNIVTSNIESIRFDTLEKFAIALEIDNIGDLFVFTNDEYNKKSDTSYNPCKQCKDPFGNIFESKIAKCDFYNVKVGNYNSKIKFGYTEYEALELIPFISTKIKNCKFDDNLYIEKYIDKINDILYFSCRFNDKETLMSREEILDYIIPIFRENYMKEHQLKEVI